MKVKPFFVLYLSCPSKIGVLLSGRTPISCFYPPAAGEIGRDEWQRRGVGKEMFVPNSRFQVKKSGMFCFLWSLGAVFDSRARALLWYFFRESKVVCSGRKKRVFFSSS